MKNAGIAPAFSIVEVALEWNGLATLARCGKHWACPFPRDERRPELHRRTEASVTHDCTETNSRRVICQGCKNEPLAVGDWSDRGHYWSTGDELKREWIVVAVNGDEVVAVQCVCAPEERGSRNDDRWVIGADWWEVRAGGREVREYRRMIRPDGWLVCPRWRGGGDADGKQCVTGSRRCLTGLDGSHGEEIGSREECDRF